MRLTDPKEIKKRSNGFGSVRTDIYFSIYTEFEEFAKCKGFKFLGSSKIGSRSRSFFLWEYSTSSTGDDETIVWELRFKLDDPDEFGLEIDWEKSTY